jgi:cell division protein FtsQ
MFKSKRYRFIKVIATIIWIMLGMGTIVLLIAAVNKKENEKCMAVEINLTGVQNNYFIDRDDVTLMLEEMNLGKMKGQAINTFNLAAMEMKLEENKWIKNAELFFDNNDVLKINIMEREPVARIFTSKGTSFYIDTSLAILPLSDKFSARLPVFTNFTATDKKLSKADTNLLKDVKNISEYILKDSFWMAQIEQVDITAQQSFEMIPKIGNQLIIFGPSENYKEKFNNLLIFYKYVLSKVGWNKYAKVNLTYKGQVVGVRRGAEDIKTDSLKTIQLMKTLVASAQKQAMDSANNIQLVQPKDDNSVPVSYSQHDKLFDALSANDEVADTTFAKEMVTNDLPQSSQHVTPLFLQSNNSNKTNEDIKIQQPPRELNFNEKPKSTLVKERIATRKFIKKPVEKPKQRPKAVMEPKNDY